MADGIDFSTVSTPAVSCLAGANYEFVGRYYAFSTRIPGKILTRAEAESISAAGLYIVAVWENGPADTIPYFTRERGLTDGAGAYQFASTTIGQPAGTPIYFAVDCDPTVTELAANVTDYFNGIRDAFAATGAGTPAYTVGVYGSGLTCTTLINAGLATTGWLASASSWRGYGDYTSWSIKQGLERKLCGLIGDPNVSQGAYGGFQVGVPAVAAVTKALPAALARTATASPTGLPSPVERLLDRIDEIAQRGIASIEFEYATTPDGGMSLKVKLDGSSVR